MHVYNLGIKNEKTSVRALRQNAQKDFGPAPLRPDDVIVILISFDIYQILNTLIFKTRHDLFISS